MDETQYPPTPLDTARAYLLRGWRPLPVPFRAKEPTHKAWQKLLIPEDELGRYFNGKPMNVGVLLGEPSGGLVDVDLDCQEAIFLAPRVLPPTPCVFGRPSKPRSHLLYIATPLTDSKRLKDPRKDPKTNKQPTIAEFRSTGLQTIFPPSTHKESGEPIEWAPDCGEPARVEGGFLLSQVYRLAALALLARHWPGEGSRHDAALALAGGLCRAGWAYEDTRETVELIALAAHDPEVKDRVRCVQTTFEREGKGDKFTGWKSLSDVVDRKALDHAREWLGLATETFDVINPQTGQPDFVVGGDTAQRPPAAPAQSDAGGAKRRLTSYPESLLSPPGIVGEICYWINSTASKPQPIFALANTLAMWGAVVGRKVRSPTNLRTNNYVVAVGPTGCGKDHSRKCVKNILESAGIFEKIVGGRSVASDAALYQAAKEIPSILFLWDEVSWLIGSITSKYSNDHQKNIAPLLMELFSSADSTVTAKAVKNEPKTTLVQPNVSFYGTTTFERLFETLTPKHVSDGLLGRILTFVTDNEEPEEREVLLGDVPTSIVGAVQAWFQFTPPPRTDLGNITRVLDNNPVLAACSPEADSIFRAFRLRINTVLKAKEKEAGTGYEDLWVRALEHAIKLALTVASGEFAPGEPITISGTTAQWSVQLTEHVISAFIGYAEENITGSEHGDNMIKLREIIKRAGAAGISKSELARKTQWCPKRKRDEMLNDLLLSERVFSKQIPSPRGPATIQYFSKLFKAQNHT